MAPQSEAPPASAPAPTSLSTRSGLSNGTRRAAPPPMIGRRGRAKAPTDLRSRLFGPGGRPVVIGIAIGVGAFIVIRFGLFGR